MTEVEKRLMRYIDSRVLVKANVGARFIIDELQLVLYEIQGGAIGTPTEEQIVKYLESKGV